LDLYINLMRPEIDSNECQILLSAIQSTREDLKEIIHENIRSVRAETQANMDIINAGLQGVNKRLDKVNGNIDELWTESNRRARIVDEFRYHVEHGVHKPWQWLGKYWWVVSIGLIIMIVGVVIVYDLVGLSGLIEILR
jgi:hypothetical protein